MPDERITDLIGFAVNKQPGEFQQTFNDIVTDRLAQAVDARKQELSKDIFNDTPEEEEEELENEDDIVDDDESEEEDLDDEPEDA